MRLILETRLRSYVLDLSAHDNQAAPDEGGGAESLVETAGAPERPQLGFCPPSDPIRKESP